MPSSTYTPIATITLTSSDSEVVFSSIPNSFRDLILVAGFSNSVLNIPYFRINGLNTSGDYSNVSAYGYTGNSYASASYSNETSMRVVYQQSMPANESMTLKFELLDANATDKHKSGLLRYGSASAEMGMSAHRVATTSAISSISFTCGSGTFNIGSSFSLFGVIS